MATTYRRIYVVTSYVPSPSSIHPKISYDWASGGLKVDPNTTCRRIICVWAAHELLWCGN